MSRITIALTVIIFTVTAAFPHEGATPGRTLHGVISMVTGGHLTLATHAGSIAVTLNAETKVENNGKPVGRDALRVGDHVSLVGTMLPGGEVVAREVHLETPNGDAPGHGHGPHDH